MSLPNIIENPISLSFTEGNISQIATLYFNCTRIKDNCSYIDNLNYQVNFEFEVLKNDKSMNSNNFEVEINYLLNDERISAKKINFIEMNEFYVEKFYKLIYFPLNILGYKKTETMIMNMIHNLDNSNLGLDYMDVSIKNHKLNIKNPKIVFIPIIGYFRNLLWSLRVFTLPALFFGIIFLQIAIYLFVKVLIMIYSLL